MTLTVWGLVRFPPHATFARQGGSFRRPLPSREEAYRLGNMKSRGMSLERPFCRKAFPGELLPIFFLYEGQRFVNCVQGQVQVFFSMPKANIGMMVG